MTTERDQGPKPPGNILTHLDALAAEGYHIAYCDHCRTAHEQRHAAWKTLDETGFKVVLVACIQCYVAELSTAVQALGAVYARMRVPKGNA